MFSFIETGEQDDRFTNNNNQNNSRRKSQASDKVNSKIFKNYDNININKDDNIHK